MISYTLFATALGLLLSQTSALGINCQSGQGNFCDNFVAQNTDDLVSHQLHNIIQFIADSNPDARYNNGDQIACVKGNSNGAAGGICAFPQNLRAADAPINPGQAANAALQLVNHNCKACGSDPLFDNDVNGGELTFDWVPS